LRTPSPKFLIVFYLLVPNVAAPSICPPIPLDSVFATSDVVFLGVLESASTQDRFVAAGKLKVLDVLKGNPPDTVEFRTGIEKGLGCGTDLTIGRAYLVFMKRGEPVISFGRIRLVDGGSGVAQWIEKHKQGEGAT